MVSYNREEICLLCNTKWHFKSNSD